MTELLFPEENYAILGACFQVYKDEGFGLLKTIYQECLQREFEYRGITFVVHAELKLFLRDRELAWV